MTKQNEWQNNILLALENFGFDTTNLIKYQSLNDSGKKFMEVIASQKNIYDYLNNLGLVNTGICPITGSQIHQQYQYSIFGKTIYLSREGSEICENIRRSQSESIGVDYDNFKNQKSASRQKAKWFTYVIIFLSAIISYYITNPNSLWSIMLFIVLFLIVLGILNFITMTFLFPLLYKLKK